MPSLPERPATRALAILVPALCVVGVLLVGISSCSDERLLVEVTPPSHDFGRVLHGETPEAVFTVKNNTERTLSLRAQANCGCFGVAQRILPLLPGESSKFAVQFKTTAVPPQRIRGKFVTLVTDHPKVSEVVVPLTGEIYRAFDLVPQEFNLGRIDGRPQDHEPKRVALRALPGFEVKIRSAKAAPENVYDIQIEPAEGGADIVIALRKGVKRRRGAFLDRVSLEVEVTDAQGRTKLDRVRVKLMGFWFVK